MRPTRLPLLAGFGGLLLLMAAAGIDALRVLKQIQARNDVIRSEFIQRNRLLNEIRSDVYLSGTYVRDYLLEPDAAKADAHRSDLERMRGEMNSTLAEYSNSEPYGSLRNELSAYWRVLAPLSNWSGDERRARGYIFLRDEVFPRRTAMLHIADQISLINEQQLNNDAADVAALFSEFGRRLVWSLLFTLLLGLALAAFSTRKILGLEKQSERARAELKDLSARLVEVQETERRTISRELHDDVGQSLSALLVGLSNLAAEIPADALERARDQLHSLRELAENSMRSVREMALLLRPSMLDDLGLPAALQWLARQTARATGLLVDVSAEGLPDDLSDEHKTCIYRVTQEALNNAVRHARAKAVHVVVRSRMRSITLTIQDDGSGFLVHGDNGLGLLGMEERVSHLNGTFRIDSSPGRGALIAIELPLGARS